MKVSVNDQEKIKKDILWRVYLVYFVSCMAALAIMYRLVRIQVMEGNNWRQKAEAMTTDYRSIEALRGNIYAEDGRLLAASVPTFEIRMDPNVGALTDRLFFRKVDSLAWCLSKLFGEKSERQYRDELVKARRGGDRFHLIGKNVGYRELKKLRTFPLFRLGRFKGGFIAVQKNKRCKPFIMLADRTIGYERQGVKPVGLEGSYNSYLKGVKGKRLMQRIAGGAWKPVNDVNEIEPEEGCDIVTSIDVNIQDVAEHALMQQLRFNNADHGCVVLMEVHTGLIKAIANLKRDAGGGYYEGYNYAIGESTEPGSTFKLASFLALLEDGYVELDDTVDTRGGEVAYYNQVMRDAHKGGYGIIPVRQVFERSSNVGTSLLVTRNYGKNPRRFVDRLYRMNLNDMLELDIPGEGAPRIKNTEDADWSGTTLPWMSIGYEVKMTPLQILTLYNAVANDGKMVRPAFVKEILRRGKAVRTFGTEVINSSICSRSTVEKAKKLLEGVVENGTAVNLRNAVYKIAGKTGTAQIANRNYGYKYKGQFSYQASFVGYFPAENPMYSCIVVVNAPSNNVYYGNLVAGPIFKEIADKVYAGRLEIHAAVNGNLKDTDPLLYDETLLPLSKYGSAKEILTVLNELDIPLASPVAQTPWVVSGTGKEGMIVAPRRIEEELNRRLMPAVIGMTPADAIYLLENAGLKVYASGAGMILEQSVAPGTPIRAGMEVALKLG